MEEHSTVTNVDSRQQLNGFRVLIHYVAAGRTRSVVAVQQRSTATTATATDRHEPRTPG